MRNILKILMAAAILTLPMMMNAQTVRSITFAVDEDLQPVEDRYKLTFSGQDVAISILAEDHLPKEKLVTSSFSDLKNLKAWDKDNFYQCVVYAYACHKSLALSPDMIWLLISQGFARYVNAHAEELRPKLVDHTGKMDLVVESEEALFSENADWPKLINGFASQIDRYTKGDIAKTITADFTTTGPVERVASQITLMESVKSYFEYIAMRLSCGIPSITIQGTPNDWEAVLSKTKQLEKYGLSNWTRNLEPILQEFIRASEGKPNQQFWKCMVKQQATNKLKGGGCSMEKPTQLDGWFLKLFPDENGQTLDSIAHTQNMPSEMVGVSFKYRIVDPTQGSVVSEIPMELRAGFIGAEEDTLTNTLTPKIGWLVNVAQEDDNMLNDLKKNDDGFLGLWLRVKEVPEILGRMEHIKSLHLYFTDDVVIPEWFYRIPIDNLFINGKMSESVKADILKRLPNAKEITNKGEGNTVTIVSE